VSNPADTLWVSHSSISDFASCPRAYYLKNIYRDPKTGHKVKVMSPALALGQAVHDTLESLSTIPAASRFATPLLTRFDASWKKISGKSGGFTSQDDEYRFRRRGEAMITQVQANPGPIALPAVKLQDDLPSFWLSESESIKLCGKIDWLEYIPATNSVRIIDFKTSKSPEPADSLQLPIYYLLAGKVQERTVSALSYWYLEISPVPQDQPLPDLASSAETLLKLARKIKLARQMERFVCPSSGCFKCRELERVLKGEGELIGIDDYGADVYILPTKATYGSVQTSYII
jgi:CRISPR/Cas system-associated exonuclease Cas4 (RecB family)